MRVIADAISRLLSLRVAAQTLNVGQNLRIGAAGGKIGAAFVADRPFRAVRPSHAGGASISEGGDAGGLPGGPGVLRLSLGAGSVYQAQIGVPPPVSRAMSVSAARDARSSRTMIAGRRFRASQPPGPEQCVTLVGDSFASFGLRICGRGRGV